MPPFNTYTPEQVRHANVLDMYHGDDREDLPDFAAIKAAGIAAIFHKCTQGSGYHDPLYTSRRVAAEAAGLFFGAYHYLDATDPATQAAFFCGASGFSQGGPLALAADFEKNSGSGGTAGLSQLLAFCQAVDQIADRSTIIYPSDLIRETLVPHPGGHMAPTMAGHEDFFRRHRLWLAEYGPHENIPYPWNASCDGKAPAPGIWLWQYSETGKINGIIGAVDLNFYAKPIAGLSGDWVN